MAYLVHTHPGDGVGHRVGASGFHGVEIENTLGALKALATADAAGEYDTVHFPYIEFDIQETKDGELVLFHDPNLRAAFPETGPNVALLRVLQEEQGIDLKNATIHDLTAAELHTLHLGGRDGQHVPTLEQFLEACKNYRVRRTLAVEVKAIRSDAARQKLMALLSEYLQSYGSILDQDEAARKLQYKPLGWAGIIAFPHFFAQSFGEFGSKEWRRWSLELRRLGIPVRLVHFHHFDYTLSVQ